MFSAFLFDELASDDLYRVLVGRSWVGGKRQQASFYTYPEVMAMVERLSAEALDLPLIQEVSPATFPQRTRVRVHFEDDLKSSELSFTCSTPFQDENKNWCSYVRGVREPVKLCNLELVGNEADPGPKRKDRCQEV
ncbi:hypothetical protein [Maridesulfovibrio sp.]|uniref:hypothetical protein n=1 Tax=Maridesulfovibrio sp. TaxID=2795000 RepID=UPI0029CA26F1|nr:hypothetical protein [Maridesulfovibrio sp.]